MKSQPAEENKAIATCLCSHTNLEHTEDGCEITGCGCGYFSFKFLGEKEAVSATTRETHIARSVESLTDEELNGKVAKLLGWLFHTEYNSPQQMWHFDGVPNVLPDYCNSLDAAAVMLQNFTTGQAIKFVKELSLILGRDRNSTSAWEAHCTESYDKTCHAIYSFITATARQRAIAFVTVMEAQKDQDLGEKEPG